MTDMLDLIYLLGQALSLLALAAGAVVSMMASDTFGAFFLSGSWTRAKPAVQHPNHRLNPADHPGYEW
jgi:hypothetical protein